jgi:crotonobetainyl-CoA:carnitine CoA-transferase CaiB-like acyl-CoA transferase
MFAALGIASQTGEPQFEIDNRGKRSVVLDLRTDEGLAAMHALLADADVLVSNMRLPALRRLGLDPDSLVSKYPRLIYGLLTGYGVDGPDAERAGYDIGAFWARSGLGHTLVPPTEFPPALRSGQGDHTTGLAMLGGVMAALFDRERTGKGRLVSTSLLRTGMYTLGWDTGVYLRFGKRESTKPRSRVRAPLMNCYRCSDGSALWLLGLEADRHWPGLVAAIGRPELLTDERFVNAKTRLEHAEELISLLDEVFATRTRDEWARAFDEHDVWWAPLNSIQDAVIDPQVLASGAIIDMTPREGEEPYRAVNSPVDFDGYEFKPGPTPNLGEHQPRW